MSHSFHEGNTSRTNNTLGEQEVSIPNPIASCTKFAIEITTLKEHNIRFYNQ